MVETLLLLLLPAAAELLCCPLAHGAAAAAAALLLPYADRSQQKVCDATFEVVVEVAGWSHSSANF